MGVKIEDDRLLLGDRLSVSFQRTLRIPDDGQAYPLPPGLGMFPLRRVEDYAAKVPAEWRAKGGFFIPLYQREALWLGFAGAEWKPNALKVGIGMINAVTGATWDEELHSDPQDYLVCPDQPWLDGINAGEGYIKQFVAMPLGLGYTVEAQLTGREEFGGIQLVCYEPRPGRFPDEPPPPAPPSFDMPFSMPMPSAGKQTEMGLAVGGRMKQKIYPDPYGLKVWESEAASSAFIHIINSEQYEAMTGEPAPPTPVTAKTYTEHGLPWFDLYDEHLGDVAATERLREVKSVRERDAERGVKSADEEKLSGVPRRQVKKLRHGRPPRKSKD